MPPEYVRHPEYPDQALLDSYLSALPSLTVNSCYKNPYDGIPDGSKPSSPCLATPGHSFFSSERQVTLLDPSQERLLASRTDLWVVPYHCGPSSDRRFQGVKAFTQPSSVDKPSAQELKLLGVEIIVGEVVSDSQETLETHLKGIDTVIIAAPPVRPEG
ncbi:hypothetical protein PM082_006198 [Marasmius tenuissimus]|nr:hypothetical protein PM082_006198 [Marasmius tenuissimus]